MSKQVICPTKIHDFLQREKIKKVRRGCKIFFIGGMTVATVSMLLVLGSFDLINRAQYHVSNKVKTVPTKSSALQTTAEIEPLQKQR